MKQDFQIGNSFDSETVALGHSKKVWRRIDEQLPGGYHVTNLADFASAGFIQAGTPVAYSTEQNADARDIVAIPFSDLADESDDAGVSSLNIIGFLQEDVPVIKHGTGGGATYNYASGNVIVKGEIYGYMLGTTQEEATAAAAAVKLLTQKNGLSIRVID